MSGVRLPADCPAHRQAASSGHALGRVSRVAFAAHFAPRSNDAQQERDAPDPAFGNPDLWQDFAPLDPDDLQRDLISWPDGFSDSPAFLDADAFPSGPIKWVAPPALADPTGRMPVGHLQPHSLRLVDRVWSRCGRERVHMAGDKVSGRAMRSAPAEGSWQALGPKAKVTRPGGRRRASVRGETQGHLGGTGHTVAFWPTTRGALPPSLPQFSRW